jgi:ATP-binding cassette subfamily B protein
VRDADKIWVLAEGRVVESGTQDEPVNAGGVYAGLWALQTGAAQVSLES